MVRFITPKLPRFFVDVVENRLDYVFGERMKPRLGVA